jgi:hypothetical protein
MQAHTGPMMHLTTRSGFVLITALAACATADAQTRMIVVNGQRLSDAQIASLEQRACTHIPNGQYWLDFQTGAWGYANNPRVQGVFGDFCGARQPSLSERRQLYRPGEILSR